MALFRLGYNRLASMVRRTNLKGPSHMPARDTQRSRVYKADNALKPFATMLPSVADVEEFCADLWKSKRFQAAFPSALVRGVPRVGDGRGRRKACGNAVEIKIPLWARRSDVVIHELAHT